MARPSLEERIAALETEMEQIKRQQAVTHQDDLPWWKQIQGRFKDDSEYDEAMSLGRQWRESFRPKDDEVT